MLSSKDCEKRRKDGDEDRNRAPDQEQKAKTKKRGEARSYCLAIMSRLMDGVEGVSKEIFSEVGEFGVGEDVCNKSNGTGG